MRSAYILFTGLFSVYIGQSIIGPILPSLVRELGLTELQGGLIMTFSAVMWMLFSPFWGRRSDLWGRKPVFMLALVGYMIGVGAFGIVLQMGLNGLFASTLLLWFFLIATRMLVGILFSGSIPSAQAYVADTTTGQTRTNALGILSAASALGTIFGPALGGFLVGLGLVAPIFASAALPIVGLVLVWLLLPRTEPTVKRGQKSPRIAWTDSRVWPILIVGVTVITIMTLINFTIGYLFQDRLQLPPQEAAQAVSFAVVASGVAALFTQTVLIRAFQLTPTMLMWIGLPLSLVAAILLIVGQNFLVLALALVFQGFGIGFSFPGYRSAISFAVEPHEQGAAAGLMSALGGIGGIIGPSVGTGLYGINSILPYAGAALIVIVGLMALVIMPRIQVVKQAAL